MKYLLSIGTLLLLLITSGPLVHAQSSCDVVGDDNTYATCCTGAAPQGDPNTCLQYQAKACQNINSDERYSTVCGCTGGATDSAQCVGYAATKSPAVQGQIGGTATSPSTTAINGTTNTSYSNPNINAATSANQQALNACNAIKFTSLFNIAAWVKCLIGAIVIPGIFTIAFLVFLWGVLKFIRSSDQKDKQDSKQFIYTGLIGLFVMVSVWGIIKILNTTLGIDTVVPALQTTQSSKAN